MKQAITRIGTAFATGAAVGLLGQIIIFLISLFIPDSSMAVMLGMLVFGILSVIAICTGFYYKVIAFGKNGAAIPVCGLMFGAAEGAAAAKAAGAGSLQAFFKGFAGVISVLGTGFLLCVILGLILH